jgi:hypothetical protein
MFKGYQLIKLNKAIGNENTETMCDYHVTTVDVLGRKTDKVLKLNQIERDFGKLRMNGNRCAKVVSGYTELITEQEFERLAS